MKNHIMKKRKLTLLTSILVLTLLSCETSQNANANHSNEVFKQKLISVKMRAKTSLTIMTMNAENLFDTEHDPGKFDFTYMPKAVKEKNPQIRRMCSKMGRGARVCMINDWNEKRLSKKINHMSQAIIANGSADIIVFQEVENIKILDRLRRNINSLITQKNLGSKYLEAVLIESPDRRGIDVAMLSKLPLAEPPKSHDLDWGDFDKPRDTRNILEATFILPGNELAKISVFAIHLPAQMLKQRYRAVSLEFLAKLLNRKKQQYLAAGQSPLIVAAGDSNITEKEAFLWKTYLSDYIISKDILTKENEEKSQTKGTHNYKGEWSYLDVLIFPKEMKSKASWLIKPNSARVANEWHAQYKMENGYRVPRAFRYPKYDGVADHFPFLIKIEKKNHFDKK